MEKNKKTSDKVFKGLVILFIVLGILVFALNIYNKNTINKAINASVEAVEKSFNASAEYSKGSDRIIVEIYSLKNEEELFNLTKEVLPSLSVIGEHDIASLLSTRTYYNGDKSNPQFYDIKFKDISKLDWNKINNFDDFLSFLNLYLD